MLKISIALLLCAGVAYASSVVAGKYTPDPNETRVDNVHYDKDLKMVIIHIHANVLWFTIEEIYGLKVKDDTDIEAVWKRIIGDRPDVLHLKKGEAK
jgi:hypothetical protein